MSYTEIHRITKSGNTRLIGEVRNAWRGAMAIWDYLEKKYLPPNTTYGTHVSRIFNDPQKIWDMHKDDRLTECERLVLRSTFDNCMVMRDDIPLLCKYFREFPGETSLPELADIMEGSLKDTNMWALCWNQTSVNADVPPKKIGPDYWNIFGS